MIMRYHWSLGIGHTYSHYDETPPSLVPPAFRAYDPTGTGTAEEEISITSNPQVVPMVAASSDGLDDFLDDPDPDDPELGMDEQENEDLGPEEWDHAEIGHEGESDDEIFEMYFM
ncbi:hypothetical protein BDZ94DRAFT_1276509 [Collybia nuda]|uniref:Uncharacterized protein n=1 Tax=Collybia nuda TaxID=64659 RepID=A0A9P6C8L7_9AGAR|nr:hypothetical protein BDZ94DRAFT_1276509 [Collybia nuda]